MVKSHRKQSKEAVEKELEKKNPVLLFDMDGLEKLLQDTKPVTIHSKYVTNKQSHNSICTASMWHTINPRIPYAQQVCVIQLIPEFPMHSKYVEYNQSQNSLCTASMCYTINPRIPHT